MNEHYYDKNILSDDLVLLNDKLVTERLSDDIVSEFGVPTVPSQALLKRVHAQLTESDTGIRKYAESVSSYADSISGTAETSAKAAFDLIRSSEDDITQISANAANYDKLTFTYKKDDKIIWLKLQNLKGDNGKALSIDASDFIKDGMVDNAAFVTSRPDPEHPGETLYGRWICIIFNTAAGKDPVYVDIDKLVPIVGEGLSSTSDISGQAMISVNWNMVARAEAITKTVKFVGNILVQEESELTTYLRNQEWTTEDRLENGSWIAVSSLTETKGMTLNGVQCVIENGDYLVIHDSDISVKHVLISELEFGKNLFVVRSNVTYAQLSSISSDLDQRLVAEIIRAKDIEAQLQENINDETARAEEAESQLENDLSQEVARAKDVETALQENIDTEIERAKDAEDGLSKRIDEECERTTNAETYLSNEVSSAIRILSVDDAGQVYPYDDDNSNHLSVIKLSNTKYNEYVADGTINESCLYVINDDYLDARGQVLSNLASSDVDSAAVTFGQFRGLSSDFAGRMTDLGVKIDAEKTRAEKAERDLSNSISSVISDLYDVSSVIEGELVAEIARARGVEDELSLSIQNIISGNNTYTGKNTFVNDTEVCADYFTVTDILTASYNAGSPVLDTAAEISSNRSITCAGGMTVNNANIPGLVGGNQTTEYLNGKLQVNAERIVAGETQTVETVIDYPEKSGTMALTRDVQDVKTKVLSSYDIESLSGDLFADTLSVVNVTNYEYDKLVADEKIKDTMLYVIKDDYLDARGQCLKNLADPVELSDAVNKAYVDGRTDGIKSVLNDLAGTLSTLVSDPSQNPTLDDIVKTIIGKLSAV